MTGLQAQDDDELSAKELATQLRAALRADSNEEVLALLTPHLPGIAKPERREEAKE